MRAVAVAEHVAVVRRDRAASGRNVADRAVQDAVVRSGEGAFLDGDIAADVQAVDLDVCVGEGADQPAKN